MKISCNQRNSLVKEALVRFNVDDGNTRSANMWKTAEGVLFFF